MQARPRPTQQSVSCQSVFGTHRRSTVLPACNQSGAKFFPIEVEMDGRDEEEQPLKQEEATVLRPLVVKAAGKKKIEQNKERSVQGKTMANLERVVPPRSVPIGAVGTENDWFWIPDGITIDSGAV